MPYPIVYGQACTIFNTEGCSNQDTRYTLKPVQGGGWSSFLVFPINCGIQSPLYTGRIWSPNLQRSEARFVYEKNIR